MALRYTHLFGPVESIAGVFCRVGCIFRTVGGHQTFYFRFVRTLQWLLFKMTLFSVNCIPMVVKYSSLKRTLQGDSTGTNSKK